MKTIQSILLFSLVALFSCSTPKSYFTAELRNKLETKSVPIDKLQFYIDRDVELRAEISSTEAKVTSGKVKIENGKYIHIIKLKKFTEGVCTKINDHSIDIAFEMGDGKNIEFGVVRGAQPYEAYKLFPTKWVKQGSYPFSEVAVIRYDGKMFHVQPEGSAAKLMIKKSVEDKSETKKRTMKGRKVE